ncbi:hypothetical protein SNE40_021754 [Patella caerulea]|uniref:Tesmin/TSO1-like CXC domain-containing protein n=1 Tax=Patella caerulea TaxID=87958 RepID=A0AAN8G8L4_PATCE
MNAEEHIIEAFHNICHDQKLSENTRSRLEEFVCSAYSPKGIHISRIPELRRYLFCKYMAESDRLPPTVGALSQHILRAQIQGRVWGQACIPQQERLDPMLHGYYKLDDMKLQPKTTDLPSAPEAIVEMVRCQCKSNCTSNRCSCKRKNLPCTDLCLCSTNCDNDEDTLTKNPDSDDDRDS